LVRCLDSLPLVDGGDHKWRDDESGTPAIQRRGEESGLLVVRQRQVHALCEPHPESDSNEILTQVIGLTCSGQTGRIHLADFDVWGPAEER
jgi:hypothetical protein